MPNVHDIWEQPNRLSYDSDGKIRHHTPDFLLTLICGKKVAVAYRPEERAKAEYRRELRRLSDQMPKGYADKFMLVTDRSFTREQAYNADLFHAFSKSPDPDADSALQDVLSTLIGHVSIENLCKLIGLVGRSFAAVVRAVFQGALKQTCKGYLELNSVVAKGALS
ncbi:MAG: TnsA endonuclease N-terminal domain-containing protein [Paracoccaceae bacterium]